MIAATNYGYRLNLDLFPDQQDEKYVARISVEKSEVLPDPLFDTIYKRCTNRKFYQGTPLTEKQKQEIFKSVKEIDAGPEIKILEDTNKRKITGEAVSKIEEVILENKSLHKALFDAIVWTEKEHQEKNSSLFIKTLEFNPIQKLLFRLASNWSMLNCLNRLGFSKFVAKQDAKLYASGAAHIILTISSYSKSSFVYLGRAFERLWLQVTKMGLSLQPITGILFMIQRIKENESSFLSDKHIRIIENSYETIREAFGVKEEFIAMFSRIGYAKPPTGRSLRRVPDLEILDF